jgi:hypothetical protein
MVRRVNGLTIMGMIMVFVFGTHLATRLLRSPEHRWTPRELAEPPSASRQRVRIHVRGTPLADVLDSGALKLRTEANEWRQLEESDLRLRFNNWYRVRAGDVVPTAISGAAFGAGLALFIVGLWVLPAVARRPAAEDAASAETPSG